VKILTKLLIIGYKIFPIYRAGTEIAIFELSKRFRNKYQLALMLYDLTQKDISHIDLKKFKIFLVKKYPFRFINGIFRFLTYMKNIIQFNPDIVFGFSISQITFWASLYCKIFRKKIILRTEGSDLNYIGNFFTRWQKYSAIRLSNEIISSSPLHRYLIHKFFPSQKQINLGNGTSLIKKNIQKNDIHPSPYFTILFVGRLIPVKNVPRILEALVYLHNHYPDRKFHLRIHGEGELKDILIRYAKDNNISDLITFTMNITREELSFLYNTADAFVLASKSEGFPLVIAEALNFGLPIICSKISSLKGILKEKENALFFNVDDSQELALKILELYEKKELRTKIAMNNIVLAKNFTWDAISTKIMNEMNFLIKKT
jgi:glycosyltransferase involved in cell wall biosynthesis